MHGGGVHPIDRFALFVVLFPVLIALFGISMRLLWKLFRKIRPGEDDV